ncbi:hypothetical protein AB0I10_34740 [Streptomyces sp. NPDC050636]|uniref:hypothetical protein n=1 Tax=Streptomyces sp. NPDC050636 TaxID=3154510 RepID=UPI0034158121
MQDAGGAGAVVTVSGGPGSGTTALAVRPPLRARPATRPRFNTPSNACAPTSWTPCAATAPPANRSPQPAHCAALRSRPARSSSTSAADSPLFSLVTVQDGEQLRLTATGIRCNLKPAP